MTELNDEEQERFESYKTRARSFSQTKQWHSCGYQFLLARIKRVPEMRGAWLEQGVAVHAVIEAYEKSKRTMTDEQVRALYQDRYSSMINQSLGVQPDESMWFSSGPYKGVPTDIERRYRVGQDQVSSYLQWCDDNPQRGIWKDCIETRFDLNLEGVEVLGFIDQVTTHPKKEGPGVTDIKTGVRPTEHTQLELYALAMNELHDAGVEWGDYWLGKTGRSSRSVQLEPQRERFVEWFATMDAGVRAGDFQPSPGEACERCPVQLSCEYRSTA